MENKKKVFFRADAGPQIGYGHFIRSLALADMLKDDFDCVFFTQSPTEYQINEMSAVCSYVGLPADDSRFDKFLNELNGNEIVVLDNYFYTTDYQRRIKEKGCGLVCIDDMHDKHYVADMIINHALTDKNLFDCEPYTKLCLGFNYALLRSPFLKPLSDIKRNNDLVVNFGGADPYGITEYIVTILLRLTIPYNIVVILGDKVHLSDENRKKVTIKKNLSAEQMAELFERSAVGILSASTVCIEALSRNLPLIVGYHVDNQKEFYQILMGRKGIQPLGLLQTTDSTAIEKAICGLRGSIVFPFENTKIKENYLTAFKKL